MNVKVCVSTQEVSKWLELRAYLLKREKNQRKEKYLITRSVCEGLFFSLHQNCSVNTVQLENHKNTGV